MPVRSTWPPRARRGCRELGLAVRVARHAGSRVVEPLREQRRGREQQACCCGGRAGATARAWLLRTRAMRRATRSRGEYYLQVGSVESDELDPQQRGRSTRIVGVREQPRAARISVDHEAFDFVTRGRPVGVDEPRPARATPLAVDSSSPTTEPATGPSAIASGVSSAAATNATAPVAQGGDVREAEPRRRRARRARTSRSIEHARRPARRAPRAQRRRSHSACGPPRD